MLVPSYTCTSTSRVFDLSEQVAGRGAGLPRGPRSRASGGSRASAAGHGPLYGAHGVAVKFRGDPPDPARECLAVAPRGRDASAPCAAAWSRSAAARARGGACSALRGLVPRELPWWWAVGALGRWGASLRALRFCTRGICLDREFVFSFMNSYVSCTMRFVCDRRPRGCTLYQHPTFASRGPRLPPAAPFERRAEITCVPRPTR